MRKYRTIFLTFIAGLAVISTLYFFSGQLESRSREKRHPSLIYTTQKTSHSYPSEWAWLKRSFPYGRADYNAIPQALKETRQLRAVRKSTAFAQWEPAGPSNIGGRVVDIEFNPSDPKIVYAAAATGGVFKSYDTGKTWQPVFDEQAVLTVGDIALAPSDPDMVYVGTGEANGGHNNFPGFGIYKSADGGKTWTHIGLDSTASIGRMLVDPDNEQKVWVAAVGSYFEKNPQRGVYVSEDGGQSWQKSLYVSDSTGAIDLVMNPNDHNILFAAMWERIRPAVSRSQTHLYGNTSAIWRTSDGGKTWQQLGTANGLPDPQAEQIGRIGLAIYPQNPDILYALYTNYDPNNGYVIYGLYKSTDGGDNWTKTAASSTFSSYVGGFSWYFGQVRVSPSNPDRVYVMDVRLLRSDDGGSNFSQLSYENLHVDHHAMAFHPQNPDYIIEGNDGGINISQDGGDTWTKVADLPVTQFYEIGLDASRSVRLYGGTQDNGTLRTPNGDMDQWERILGGDGFYVLVDPTDPEIVYAEYQWGELYKIAFGSYTPLITTEMKNEPRNWSTPVEMDPLDNTILYYGTNRLWRTEDAGKSWQPISPDLTRGLDDSRLGTITTISVAPSNPEVIYAGTDDGKVWVSADYGDSWQDITGDLPFRWVTRVKADPQRDSTVYVTFSGLRWRDPQPHVFRSDDMGQSWQDISANLPDAPVNAFAVDPKNTDILYVGSDIGAFVSFDRGASWQILGEGLPAVVVNDMKVNPDSYELIVGTHGRSIYKIDLYDVTTMDAAPDRKPIAGSFILRQNYPNPFNPSTTVRYRLSGTASVELNVYDLLGQKITTLASGKKGQGWHEARWNARGQAAGIYFYRLLVNGKYIDSKKMVLLQ